ncbi:hypothetical protein GGX14DRAFT_608302 [Mycena pura]|uniref:Uncharacterized protein n=1 Tax=Mycena pura TaxID=153505 RepID=A0AAD6VNT1_9AGAR|nr:hypothetical protein GGX14DRAFT_608302 [Mycena pura]
MAYLSIDGSGTIDGLTWQATVSSRRAAQNQPSSTATPSSSPRTRLNSSTRPSPPPRASATSSTSYTWKQYLYASTGTGTSFFYLMQLFDDTAGEPVMTLDAVSGTVTIHDFVHGDGEASCGAKACPTTDIANYYETTTTYYLRKNWFIWKRHV